MRENTAHLHTRDNVLKHKVLSNNFDYRQPSFFKRIKPAMSRCLSLTYAKKAEFKPKRLKGDIDKYTWLLSGFGARGDRYPKKNWRENSEQGRGTSVGPLGLALAAAAIILQRKKYPWILFGTGLFLGNLAFFLWHSIWDNLTFTIPGQIGLCLLVGLGAAGWQKSKKPIRLTIFQMACLTAPAFLLITNYSLINMATPENTRQIEYFKKLSGALPEESVVIDSYWPAMALRYMIYVEAKRTDVYVFNVENRSPQKKRKLVDYFTKVGKPVFMKSMGIPTKKQQTLRRHTPAQVARLGLLLVNPEFWTVKQKQINQQP